ncbi:MAG: flagellar motor switch protein FliN [Candidatus Brocadiae bacterium]|nr:flagellar motor switch protein FliN [Candidatus Brocadiia bacterium]
MAEPPKPTEADVERLLKQITGEGSAATGPRPAAFESVTPSAGPAGSLPQDMLLDVPLNVRIELGRTKMRLEDLLGVGRGTVITLDQLAGEPLDIYVNDRLVARGEVLVLHDNFCVRVTEIIGQPPRK